MGLNDVILFCLDEDTALARSIADRLGIELAPHELRVFSDSEMKLRPLVSVRRRDVFVVTSLAASGDKSVNDALCRLLFFAGALRDAGAAQVAAVVPYLAYARKDRRTKARDPVTTRYMAQLFEAMGVSRIATLEVHNEAAFENAFRCATEHLESAKLFAAHLATKLAGERVTVVSPDAGGVRRADRFRRALAQRLHVPPGFGFMEKWRSQDIVGGDAVAGDIEGRTVVIFDDMISTGGTIARAAEACKERAAKAVLVAAAHGIFLAGAAETLARAPIERILVTNSLPQSGGANTAFRERIEVVDAGPLLAHAIESIHAGGSISETLTL